MVMFQHEAAAFTGSILVVDDTPNNLRLLTQVLRRQGYKVRVAEDGPGAIESARASLPDLVLLDIRMPGMDGFEVCRQLKAEPATSDIPIIFISALDATEDKVNAFTAGGVDYITKPLEPDEVLARVKTHLTLRDAQKRLQEQARELKAYAQELEARNAELDAFAHTVAHDLKNPLTLLLTYAVILETDYMTMPVEEMQQYLRGISQSVEGMNGIINELLLLASMRRMEQVQTEPVDMTSVVDLAQQRLSISIAQTLAHIKKPGAWPLAIGYAPWIIEVWANYLSNAIKYGGTPPEIELGFDKPVPESAGAEAYIRFWVRDNGEGLTPENRAKLFAEFTQVGQPRAGGHGLGLSIVRRIVERLHGQVGVESVVGQGSTFWFTLPALFESSEITNHAGVSEGGS
ncbi:MAG: hybrid sensor histidine kinase/response regulator [Anaerolineae bacterium]